MTAIRALPVDVLALLTLRVLGAEGGTLNFLSFRSLPVWAGFSFPRWRVTWSPPQDAQGEGS